MKPLQNVPTVPRRRHALWACLAAVYAAFIFLLSTIPGSRLSEFGLRPGIANLCHIPLYGGFAGLVLMAFAGSLAALRRGPWPTLYAIAAVMTYAITDEFHQRFVPGRTSSVGDLARDFLGAVLVLIALHAASRRRGHVSRERGLADRAGTVSPGLLLGIGIAAAAFTIYFPALQYAFANSGNRACLAPHPIARTLGGLRVDGRRFDRHVENDRSLALASTSLDGKLHTQQVGKPPSPDRAAGVRRAGGLGLGSLP